MPLATRSLIGSLIGGCALTWGTTCLADVGIADDWHIYGSNTGRVSVYDARGNGAASPYPFEGLMGYDEFNVYFNKSDSRFDLWRGEVSGVFNYDDYRSSDLGVVPERLSLVRENGESALPYRAEAGDFFAYYSYLTQQRSLKGFQLELQPIAVEDGRRHSILFSTGVDSGRWRDLTPKEDYTTGLSWLLEDMTLGSLSANVVHNFRDGSARLGSLDRNQFVFSLAGEKPFHFRGQNLVFEAEAAHFQGDHDGTAGAASGQKRADNGYFAELRGNSTQNPLDYRFRYERYGQDFRPRGAIVTPDRRSYEGHGGWLFDSGIRLRGRVQKFDDSFETANTLRTRTYGINLSGPLFHRFLPDVAGRIDAFIQNRDNETDTVSQLVHSLSVDLSKPLPSDWTGRLGLFIQDSDDRTAANSDLLTQQITFSADHAISLGGFSGFITPGILLRKLRKGGNDSFDMNPTLATRLSRGPHSVNMDYGLLSQNRRASVSGPDIDTHTLNFDYRYRRKQHLFGVEINLFRRNPDGSQLTDAYRVSAYWTYEFDRPPVSTTPVARRIGPAPEAAPGAVPENVLLIAPGTPRADVENALKNAGVSRGISQAGVVVYEYPLLRDVLRRQRLAFEYRGGLLERSALIIDFDEVGDGDSVFQTFERVRQQLLRQLGNPVRTYQEGDFSDNFAADVNDQQFIRITEWVTQEGTLIRYGIPRRLDGQVRMEVQHARRFLQPRETLWSIDAVR